MPGPRVSVVMPVFNAEPFLWNAARSALDRPETLELLLIEDGSSDGSEDVCARLAAAEPDRVVHLSHDDGGNHGPSASRNLGIRHARGSYIAFLDADDWYLANRFENGLRLLEDSPKTDGVYEAVGVAFEDEAAREEWRSEPGRPDLITLPAGIQPDHLLSLLVGGDAGSIHTGGLTLRRDAFESTGLFDVGLALGQDTAMWWKLAARCRLVGGELNSPVAMYRRHAGNRASLAHAAYATASIELAAAVWRWARATDVGGPARRALHEALAARVSRAPPGQRGLQGLSFRARNVLRYVIAFPSLVLEPSLWRIPHAASGGRRRDR